MDQTTKATPISHFETSPTKQRKPHLRRNISIDQQTVSTVDTCSTCDYSVSTALSQESSFDHDNLPTGSVIEIPMGCTTTSKLNIDNNCRVERKSRVTFGMVHVRKYEVILGDHPECRSGPSIGIGWRYQEASSHSLKYWEERKGGRRPKTSDQLLMSRHQRESLLRDWCYLQRDVAAMIRVTNKVKNQRRQTIQNLKLEPLEERLESLGAKVGSLIPKIGRRKCGKKMFV